MRRGRLSRQLACVAVAALACIALAAPGAARAPRAAQTTLSGTLVFPPAPVRKVCRGQRAGTKAKPLMRLSCGATGTYRGRPARAGANYYWTWTLPIDNTGTTKALGPEVGRIGLNFGGGKIVYLSTQGAEKPRGATAGRTTGTWVVSGGTGTYASASGNGTYVFDTKIVSSRLTVMKLVVKGSIS
jgi:hypothetical protein